ACRRGGPLTRRLPAWQRLAAPAGPAPRAGWRRSAGIRQAVGVQERDEHRLAAVGRERHGLTEVLRNSSRGAALAGSASVPHKPRPGADCCAPPGSAGREVPPSSATLAPTAIASSSTSASATARRDRPGGEEALPL